MKLLSIKQENNLFIIVTDQGQRQVSLSWKTIDNIRQKALELLGKEIEVSTYGNFDPKKWFSDITAVNHDVFTSPKSIDKKYIDIVGLQHRNISFSEIKTLINEFPITFEFEPTNPYDNYAIKCNSNYKHIGYIDKGNSRLIHELLSKNPYYEINIINIDEYKINAEIVFKSKKNNPVQQSSSFKSNKEEPPSINNNELNRLPYGLEFSDRISQKIYGPPGTGKTFQLIAQVKKAVTSGINLENIGFISFSNEAANVARIRVAEEFKHLGSIDFPNFCTMHSLATRVGGTAGYNLCEEKHFNEFDKSITCWNEWTQIGDPSSIVPRLMHPILDGFSLSINKNEKFDYRKHIKNYKYEEVKACLINFFKLTHVNDDDIQFYCQKYINDFIDYKNTNKLLNFDDVVIKVSSSEFDKNKIPTFELLIIDEAQDLSKLLWEFAEKLILRSKTTFIAGDDDQAIMEGMGASSETFVNLKTTVNDDELELSYRIPKSVRDYVDQGVMKALKILPNRKEKIWMPQNRQGTVNPGSKTTQTINGNVTVIDKNFTIKDLIEEINLDWIRCSDPEQYKSNLILNNKKPLQTDSIVPDWLIMSPTKATAEGVSKTLKELDIPHFFRNKPILNAKIDFTYIRVQTIHISKGAEAENTAIVANKFSDIKLLADDPKLAYVALTRAKNRMFPRVIRQGLLPEMQAASWIWSSALKKYNASFPIM